MNILENGGKSSNQNKYEMDQEFIEKTSAHKEMVK